ncbi:MAG TPA: hypothetical protein VNX60_08350 [Candidatus Acidoferrum sp.]|nr:hypothetical protein [Candidatus Acidoferrum sp.]
MRTVIRWIRVFIVAVGLLVGARLVLGQDKGRPSGSYVLVDIDEAFSVVLARISAAKTDFLRRRMALFDERYDFRDDHEPDVATSRGKPIQRVVRAKLAQRITWNQLAGLTPEQIKNRDIFPAGFLPSLTPIIRRGQCSS